jgi:hypothetical protein
MYKVIKKIKTPQGTAYPVATNSRYGLVKLGGSLVNTNGEIDVVPNYLYGAITFEFDGVQDVFEIPHGLGAIPSSISLTFSDGSNIDFIQSSRTIDATNITITCVNPPSGVDMTVYWQVYK